MTTPQVADLMLEIEALKARVSMQDAFLRSATHEWHYLLQRIIDNSQALVQNLHAAISQEQLLALQQLNNSAHDLIKSVSEIVPRHNRGG